MRAEPSTSGSSSEISEKARRASSIRSPGVAGRREPSVEIEGGADERQMSESLRKVAKVLRLGPELLAIQPQMIGVPEHLLEEQPCLLEISHAGEALDVPEGTHREGAFVSREPVGESVSEPVAIHQRIADQLVLDRTQRRYPAQVGRGDEADERHQQRRGVERGGAGVLHERVPRRVPEASEDIVVDRVPYFVPARQGRGERALAGESD